MYLKILAQLRCELNLFGYRIVLVCGRRFQLCCWLTVRVPVLFGGGAVRERALKGVFGGAVSVFSRFTVC